MSIHTPDDPKRIDTDPPPDVRRVSAALRPPPGPGPDSAALHTNGVVPAAPVAVRSAATDDDEDPLLGNLLQIFWQRKWTVLLCVLAGALGGVIYLSKTTPVYRSTAMVFIDQSRSQLMGGAGNQGFVQQSMDSQAQVLTSTTILARAIELPAMKQAESLWQQPNPLGFLRANLQVNVSDAADIFRLSMDSTDPEDNAIAVNAVVQAFSEYHNDRRRNTSAEILKVLSREKQQLNDELKRLTDEQLSFQRRHGTAALRTADGGNVFASRVSRLADTLTEAELRTLNAKLAYETAVEAGDDLNALKIVAATDPSFAGFDIGGPGLGESPEAKMIALLERERYTLVNTSGFGTGHKQIEVIDAQIRELERSAAVADGVQNNGPEAVAAFYRDQLKQRWQNAQAAAAEYRTIYEAQEAEAVGLNSLQAEYGILETAAARSDRQLEVVDQRIRELNLNDDYDVVEVTVLEPAEPAAEPVYPKRSRTLAMALILSLMLGGGLAFVQEMLDDRLRSGEEIAGLLGLPILGVIPMMQEKVSMLCGQIVSLQPQSVVAEAFRTVRTAIHFSPRGGQTKVIMVTSPSPGDGKSTVASNLAIAVAQGGKRTILVDADCRKPRQHRIFELSGKHGLSTLLQADSAAGLKMSVPVFPTGVDNLDLMPAGPEPNNPSELLNSRRFVKLVGKLREHYDQIIIDTPPTVLVSDSRIISTFVDGYVLVLRAGKSGRKTAKHATELLASVGATPLGLVVNGVTSAWGSYAYYSRYGYYQSGYGAYRNEPEAGETKKGRLAGLRKKPALELEPEEVGT